jgi:predicted RNase H-like HicB family nuclease
MVNLGNFNIKVFQEDDWSYYAEVINLPWCFTSWETIEKLNINLKEAIISYLWSVKKDLKNFQFHITSKDITHA